MLSLPLCHLCCLLCNPEPKYFPSCLHGRRNSGSASFAGRGRVDDGAPPLVEETARSGSSPYARPGGQGSAVGGGTGLGPWDGTHSFESKVQGPRSKVFGPLGSEAVRGERARGVRLNLPHLTWGPGRDTGWDGTSILSHGYFRPAVISSRVATDNVPGGEKIPGGNEIWIPAGDGDPFSLRGERIPGNGIVGKRPKS